jgi:SRSO17 transposase
MGARGSDPWKREAFHRDYWRSTPHAEEWFLVEWHEGESQPTKYWLSTLPPDTTI